MAQAETGRNLYDDLVVDVVAEDGRHKKALREYSQTLARDILDKGRQPSIKEALVAVFGFVSRDERRTEFERTLGRVERASLGRLAIFNDGLLETVGVLDKNPLDLRLGYAYSPHNINALRLEMVAKYAYALNRNLHYGAGSPYSPVIENSLAQRFGYIEAGHDQLHRVEVLEGVKHSFDVLDSGDTVGREMMGGFYDKLAKHSSQV